MAYPSPELRAYSCNYPDRLRLLRGFLLIGFMSGLLVGLAPQTAYADGEEEEKPSLEGYVIDDPLYNIERKVDTIDEKVDRLDRKADAAADQLEGIEGLMTAEKPAPKGYLFGSVGMAFFDVSKSDISSVNPNSEIGVTPDGEDFMVRGGYGHKLGRGWAVEAALADLGSAVNVVRLDSAALRNDGGRRKVDLDYNQVFELGLVHKFNLSLSGISPSLRVGIFAHDGDIHDDTAMTFGAGANYGPLRLEYQIYDFSPRDVETLSVTYMLPFSFSR